MVEPIEPILTPGEPDWEREAKMRRETRPVPKGFLWTCLGLIAILLAAIVVAAMVGCSSSPVYEYRIVEELSDSSGQHCGLRWYTGDKAPRIMDGLVEIGTDTGLKYLPAEDVEIERVQIGPHQCECGAILRTYRDRCRKCGQMILMGCRTPPSTEIDQ